MRTLRYNVREPYIFYDGGCPLCRKEIQHYQRIAPANSILWIDITRNPEELKRFKIKYKDAMEQLHGISPTGEKIRGVESFMMIWEQLPYYRWLARGVRLLKLKAPLQKIYLLFTRWRINHRCNRACSIEPRK